MSSVNVYRNDKTVSCHHIVNTNRKKMSTPQFSPSQIMAVSDGMKNKLQEVARTAIMSDNELDEKIIISFVGAKSTYKTGILYTHGKKKIPKEMELPIYFAHSNYMIKLSADHKVTFDPRDLRDDDDKEV